MAPLGGREGLVLEACCVVDVDRAARAWEQLVRLEGGEDAVLDWLSVGPPRRLLPVLGSRVEALGLSHHLADVCAAATAEAWGLNQAVFETGAVVVDLLTRAGIEVMTMKGLALSCDVYAPHRLRAIGDVDLLVRPGEHRRAVRVLERAGFSRDPWVPPPMAGATAVTMSRPGLTAVDLHARPARNLPHRSRGGPSCWQGAERLSAAHPLTATSLTRPSTERHLVILAAHLALAANQGLLHPVLDLHQLLTASAAGRCPALDTDRLVAAADDEGARGRLSAALQLVVGRLGAPGPAELPDASARERSREEAVCRADRRRSRRAPGAGAAAARLWPSVRVSTAGQGPVAAGQVAANVIANRLWILRHRPAALAGESADRSGSPGSSGVVAASRSLFGCADDGAVVEIRSSRTDLLEGAISVWPPLGLELRTGAPDGPPVMVMALSGTAAAPVVHIDTDVTNPGWDSVESALGLFAAERLADAIAVHAAVMVWDGSAVIVPGPSFAGKSTLAVAAAEAGATIASDEFALIDPETGLVRGWNRRARMRTPNGIVRIDLSVEIEPTPISVVAAVVHHPDATSELRTLSPAETAFALLANTVCASSRPLEAIATASMVSRSVVGVGGTRGEAAECVVMLRDLCRSHRHDDRAPLADRS